VVTATHASTLQHSNDLQDASKFQVCTAAHCNILQFTPTHYNTTQHCNTLQRPVCRVKVSSAHFSTLQNTATQTNTLQHTATHRNDWYALPKSRKCCASRGVVVCQQKKERRKDRKREKERKKERKEKRKKISQGKISQINLVQRPV